VKNNIIFFAATPRFGVVELYLCSIFNNNLIYFSMKSYFKGYFAPEDAIIYYVIDGIDFEDIFEENGLLLNKAELQKTKVLVLLVEKHIKVLHKPVLESFISFTNDSETSIRITHYSSRDALAPALFTALDEYCLENGINTILVSIPKNISGLLTIYERAGFKKLRDGLEELNPEGLALSKRYELIKEIKE
jgi:L-amino acid N-acyltransferase YncA